MREAGASCDPVMALNVCVATPRTRLPATVASSVFGVLVALEEVI